MAYNSRYLSNRPFLCIDHFSSPLQGVHTEKKGWGDNATNWSEQEISYILERVSTKVLQRAHLIIDLLEHKIIKDREGHNNPEDVMAYYRRKYAAKIMEAMQVHEARKIIASS